MSQRVLILGATSAIASEVARLYAARGARLCLVARNAEKLTRLVGELPPDQDKRLFAELQLTRQDLVVATCCAAASKNKLR